MLELLIVVAIVGTLSFAIPSFVTFFSQQQLTSDANEFVLAIAYARSEASRRQATVSVQALDDQGAENEYGEGWCVVVGNPGACGADDLRRVTSTGVRFDATGDLNEVTALNFDQNGLLRNVVAGNTDILVCPDDGRGRRITLSPIGRTRVTDETLDDLGCGDE